MRLDDREVLPRVVAALVGLGVAVYGVSGAGPTLEDVYFAVDARAGRAAPEPAAAR